MTSIKFRSLLGLLSVTFFPGVISAGDTADHLMGTTWGLVEIQSMNDTVTRPSGPDQFTLAFGEDGTVAAKVDCNRGTSSYTSESKGQLLFGPMATTRALCAPDSIDQEFLSNIEYVRSYVFRDGDLYLTTMADGSILQFTPVDGGGDSLAPSFDCSKASGKVEQTICSDSSLAALDRKLDTLYKQALISYPEDEIKTLKAYQRGWIKGRNDCWKATDLETCVRSEYDTRITDLQIATGSQMVPAPTLFDCDGGSVLTAYFYPDTQVPAAVFNKHPDQITALATDSETADAAYTAANFLFTQTGDSAQLTWLAYSGSCKIKN